MSNDACIAVDMSLFEVIFDRAPPFGLFLFDLSLHLFLLYMLEQFIVSITSGVCNLFQELTW